MSSFPPNVSPLLCAPADKPILEAQNQARLLTYIQDFAAAREGPSGYLFPLDTENTLLKLHSLTIQGIYPCAGTLRDAMGNVTIAGAVFTPQPGHIAQNALRDLLDHARKHRANCHTEQSKVNHATDCFHHFLHIHPFFGGNGRVARAFLLMMFIDMSVTIIPDEFLAYVHFYRHRYLRVLQAADTGDMIPIHRFMMRGIYDSRLLFIEGLLATSATIDAYFRAKLSPSQQRLLGPRTLTAAMSDTRYIREARAITKYLDRYVREIFMNTSKTERARG